MMSSNPGALLPLLVAWPLVAAGLAACIAGVGGSRRAFDLFVTVSVALTLIGVAMLIAPVLDQTRIGATLPFGQARIRFVADPIGVMFALAAALVWFCSTLYATAWLRDDRAPVRYQLISLVLLAANLGVVLAGDLLTLYICFEVLGLGALLLVVHDGSLAARRAGVKYFWMTIIGGVALLVGILLFNGVTGSIAFSAVPNAVDHSTQMWASFCLLLIGFGVKAGMVPLHVWLPDAHPVAPPPGSALLSGVMIKVGAYGIFRVLHVLFIGEPGPVDKAGATLEAVLPDSSMGLIVLWLGLATMAIGVILALGQRQAKRMLAWHSVSQMGFVLTGLGAGAYLGTHGAMASAGGLLHVFNHGLFKGALFLGAGAVAMRAGTADMYRLGGLWRRMPVTFACMLVAAAGITGVPLFNGFVSKCMIHHGLVEAADRGGGLLLAAEWIFLATCAGTFASFLKLIWLVFLREPDSGRHSGVREAPAAMLAGMALLVLPIIFIGLNPNLLLEGLIAPGLSAVSMPAEPIPYYLSHYFLSAGDFRSFAGMAIAGSALFVLGMRYGLFHCNAPAWLGVDYWYRAAGSGFVSLCQKTLTKIRWRDLEQTIARGVVTSCYRFSLNNARLQEYVQNLSGRGWNRLVSLPHRSEPSTEQDEDRDFGRLDSMRDRIRAKTETVVWARTDELAGPERERLVNRALWISGLLGTHMLEQAMAAFGRVDNRQAMHRWLSAAEKRTEAVARSALELAVAWRPDAAITDAELQASLRKTLPSFPAVPETARALRLTGWRDELRTLLFTPADHHWPVTESLDRGRLAEKIRDRLEAAARNLTLALALVLALLAFLLIGSIR